MKVAHFNTYVDYGGAAIAARRIIDSVNRQLPGSCRLYTGEDTPLQGSIRKLNLVAELLSFGLSGGSNEYRFQFSPGFFGGGLLRKILEEADILHLHWINQGFISVESLTRIARYNKPVVWTLHDMWAMTGGCHYAGKCNHFEKGCGDCFMISRSREQDLSSKRHNVKKKIYETVNLNPVTCSNWLASKAEQSTLLKDKPVRVIGNPIDTQMYCPGDKVALRKEFGWKDDSFVVIMSAFKITNERKGFLYLRKALEYIKQSNKCPLLLLVLVGESSEQILLPFQTVSTGYLKKEIEIIKLYQAADVLVLPSLEENLPNTIMEAMSCGIPAVAFDTGGIADLIDHRINGFLATLGSAESLAQGLLWCHDEQNSSLSEKARKKIVHNFGMHDIGKKYLDLYESLLKENLRQ